MFIQALQFLFPCLCLQVHCGYISVYSKVMYNAAVTLSVRCSSAVLHKLYKHIQRQNATKATGKDYTVQSDETIILFLKTQSMRNMRCNSMAALHRTSGNKIT